MTQKPASLLKGSEFSYLKRAIYDNCINSYEYYCEIVHKGRWAPYAHHRLICDELQKIANRKLKRLMIFMPPRHGKSMTVTETFPAYFIGKNPSSRVIQVSYGDVLARKFGRANRDKIEEYGEPIFGNGIDHRQSAYDNFMVNNGIGGMISTGYGGGVTGQGADLLIIDDPIKNRQEAESPTYRERLWDEYRNTLYSRLHPGGAIILILTRWHEDDLAGRLLNPEYGPVEDWTILDLPAVCVDPSSDILGRSLGEPLWPSHGYDKEWADMTKAQVGSYAWSALYQQRPSPPEGGIFNRAWMQQFWTHDTLPARFEEAVWSWDLTFKDGTANNYVAGQAWGKLGAKFYLLRRIKKHLSFVQQVLEIRSAFESRKDANKILIEDAANGSAAIDTLKNEIPGIIPIKPKGSKSVRAYSITPLFEAGNIILPSRSIDPGIDGYIEELCNFPNGVNDDEVDATTQALNEMTLGPKARSLIKPGGWL